MPIKVTIDYRRCCGYAICAEVCPEVFGIAANGFGVVKAESVEGDIADKVHEAADSCPERAIDVTA